MNARSSYMAAAVALGLIAGAALLRRPPKRAAAEPKAKSVAAIAPTPEAGPSEPVVYRTAPPKPAAVMNAEPDRQALAVHESGVRDLIRQAKVAALRNDDATRSAMLAGLRRSGARARELALAERDAASDPSERSALSRIADDLNAR
jgi:hypothetical protein